MLSLWKHILSGIGIATLVIVLLFADYISAIHMTNKVVYLPYKEVYGINNALLSVKEMTIYGIS